MGLQRTRRTFLLGKEHFADGLCRRPVRFAPSLSIITVASMRSQKTLKFGPGLTVDYGDNAAGNSGYLPSSY